MKYSTDQEVIVDNYDVINNILEKKYQEVGELESYAAMYLPSPLPAIREAMLYVIVKSKIISRDHYYLAEKLLNDHFNNETNVALQELMLHYIDQFC